MRKKVLFVIKEMYIGGSRKSLCSLLNALANDNRFELYLLNMSSTGELLTEIPSSVKIMNTTSNMRSYFAKKSDLSFLLIVRKAVLRFLYRLQLGDKITNYLMKEWCKKNKIIFDVIVGGQEGISDEASLMIPGKKHIIWFHCDYDKYCTIVDESNKEAKYSEANSIIFVSEKSSFSFKKKYPSFAEKCKVIRNIVDKNEIINKAKQLSSYRFCKNCLRIVSVGRLSYEKGFDRIPEIVKRLKDKNIDVEWVIVGGGDLLDAYNKCVRENKLEHVHFIGQNTNPYAIIKQADLYVMTSRFEAQPLVLIESLMLGIPVISTNFDSVREVISETQNYGKIVENSVSGITNGMLEIICNNKIYEMKNSAKNFKYSNDDIIKKVCEELIN